MNKKILLVIVVFAVLSIFFCGCGGKSASSVPVPAPTTSVEQNEPGQISTSEPAPTDPTPTSAPEPTPEPAPKVDVEWQTLTYQWEDSSGYTFEATIKISPWINTKNEEYVTAAWDEVSQSRTLPTFDPNERAYYNGKCGFDGVTNPTDMYYCIGELSIKNTTSGWSITSDNPIATDTVCLSPVQKSEKDSISERNSRTIAKVVFNNKIRSDYTWAIISPKLQSDNWGPVPFVFAHYDRKTPKYPDGEYLSEISDTVFCVSNAYYSKVYSSSIKINIVEEGN